MFGTLYFYGRRSDRLASVMLGIWHSIRDSIHAACHPNRWEPGNERYDYGSQYRNRSCIWLRDCGVRSNTGCHIFSLVADPPAISEKRNHIRMARGKGGNLFPHLSFPPCRVSFRHIRQDFKELQSKLLFLFGTTVKQLFALCITAFLYDRQIII